MAKKRAKLMFRNRRGEQRDVVSYPATTAKNNFGRVFEKALSDGAVAITRHETPRAILLSIEEFLALVHKAEPQLDTLSGEFDAMMAKLQTPEAREALDRAFHASPEELGRAAVAAARKRSR